MARNAYEVEGRIRKVLALSAALDANRPGMTAKQLEQMDDDGRKALARLAGCRPPSPDTWAQLVHLTATRAAQPADPFEGLG